MDWRPDVRVLARPVLARPHPGLRLAALPPRPPGAASRRGRGDPGHAAGGHDRLWVRPEARGRARTDGRRTGPRRPRTRGTRAGRTRAGRTGRAERAGQAERAGRTGRPGRPRPLAGVTSARGEWRARLRPARRHPRRRTTLVPRSGPARPHRLLARHHRTVRHRDGGGAPGRAPVAHLGAGGRGGRAPGGNASRSDPRGGGVASFSLRLGPATRQHRRYVAIDGHTGDRIPLRSPMS